MFADDTNNGSKVRILSQNVLAQQPATTDERVIEKRVFAAQLHPIVRRLRSPAADLPLDDHRPADRSTSYHTTAATANIFRVPRPAVSTWTYLRAVPLCGSGLNQRIRPA